MRRLALLCLLLAPIPALASQRDELAQTKKEQAAADAKSEKLAREVKKIAAEKAKIQAELVRVAGDIQKGERELSGIEEKIRVLGVQIDEKTASLAARKKELAAMIGASIKLSQTPAEAIILMPGDMMNNMTAARALKMTADSVKREAESIRTQMAELEQLKIDVNNNRAEVLEKQKVLDGQRQELKTQIAARNKLQAELDAQQKQAADTARNLAKKAEDLQSLITALDEEAKQQAAEQDNAPESTGVSGKLRSFALAKGNIRAPVAGKVEQSFGVESKGSTSRGVTVIARSGAQVTAPYDGEVLFTGPFLAYGRMIIIRHSDGFHTLLAGLKRIDVSVGQFLLEGEPIGAMGDRETDNRLYIELRKNSQPINPAPWIRGLK